MQRQQCISRYGGAHFLLRRMCMVCSCCSLTPVSTLRSSQNRVSVFLSRARSGTMFFNSPTSMVLILKVRSWSVSHAKVHVSHLLHVQHAMSMWTKHTSLCFQPPRKGITISFISHAREDDMLDLAAVLQPNSRLGERDS